MPESLDRWRKARAEVAHDWLERGLLPVLNTPGDSPEDSSRRAGLCLEDWSNEVAPRLDAALAMLPDCLLPGLLLRGWLDDKAVERIDTVTLNTVVGENLLLRNVATEIRGSAEGARSALGKYSSSPSNASRSQAFSKVMTLRIILQQSPKNVVLP